MTKTIFSEEHKAAISRSKMGQKHTEAAKAAISQKMKEVWIKRKALKAKSVGVDTLGGELK